MKHLPLWIPTSLSILIGLLVAAGWIILKQHQAQRVELQLVPQAQPESSFGKQSFAAAVQQASPSVVTIYTTRNTRHQTHPLLSDPTFADLFSEQLRQSPETSLGSGVLMSNDGYILTNDHVIENAEQILVLLADGRRLQAQILGRDAESDLALLKTNASGLQGFKINRNTLQVGDLVLAIGNPLNVGQTVTLGIVSATGRNQVGLNTYENFIQTDAAINPGNSGGALVNARGELIGINTAIFSQSGGSQGIGFAIPIGLALEVMSQMIVHGRVIRGWLGVETNGVFEIESHIGVLVTGVLQDAPAKRAGLQKGDLIVNIDGVPITDVRHLLDRIAAYAPGSDIELKVWRDHQFQTVTATAEERPQQ